MKREKQPFEDDGRTIAPMDFADHPSPFGRLPKRKERVQSGESENTTDVPPISKQERRAYVFSALKASLLIGGVFILVLGLFVLLLDILLYYL